ncbi:MAG: imidazole glycerol phosphate synthase subunit HisH [Chitinophagaceae bacterium]
MQVVIIAYNAGNIQSVQYALNRLQIDAVVTNNHEAILAADKVIFPGVGEANSAMNSLKETNLHLLIPQLKQPVLGICVGMQLMCSYSEENNTHCLGIIDAPVKLFKPDASTTKVPQMGWNNIYDYQSPLFDGLNDNSFVYYVHSYYVPLGSYTIATTNYVQPYSAAIQKNNFYGVQFHAEKSAAVGEQILQNFLKLS